MSTFNQIFKKPKSYKFSKPKRPILYKKPQRKGTCLRVFVTTPKKPNSALRKVAKLRFNNKKTRSCHIPGESHTLQKHSTVLIQGSRVRDLPGVNYRAIRGLYDLKGVTHRMSARSKYGVKASNLSF